MPQNLNDIQRKRLTENSSKLGRSCLSIIPFNQPLRLSNTDVASALHDRSLAGSSIPTCSFCGLSLRLGMMNYAALATHGLNDAMTPSTEPYINISTRLRALLSKLSRSDGVGRGGCVRPWLSWVLTDISSINIHPIYDHL